MRFFKAVLPAAALGALVFGASVPASADAFAAFTDQFGQPRAWHWNSNTAAFTADETVQFSILGDAVNPALDGTTVNAHLVFSGVVVPVGAIGPFVVGLQSYHATFTGVGGPLNGVNLLTVQSGGPGPGGYMTGILGTHAGLTLQNDNQSEGPLNYTSSIFDLGTMNNSSLTYAAISSKRNGRLDAGPGLTFTSDFYASGAGVFSSAPVPEASSLIAFGGMVLGGGLLGFRRRRA